MCCSRRMRNSGRRWPGGSEPWGRALPPSTIVTKLPPLTPQNVAPPDPIPSPQAGAGEGHPAARVQRAVPGAAGINRVPGGRSCLTLPAPSRAAGPRHGLAGTLAAGQERD